MSMAKLFPLKDLAITIHLRFMIIIHVFFKHYKIYIIYKIELTFKADFSHLNLINFHMKKKLLPSIIFK